MRVVVLVFGQDGVCFPSGPFNRLLVDGSCPPHIPGTDRHPAAPLVCGALQELGLRPTTVDTLPQDGCFAMVVLADMEGTHLEPLRQKLTERGQTMGLTLRVQREDVFRAMHRI